MLPMLLDDHASILRTQIKTMNTVNRKANLRNCRSKVMDILNSIVPINGAEQAGSELLNRCERVSQTIAMGDKPEEVEKFRANALSKLDQLEQILQSAKPSRETEILGLGW